MQDESNRHWRNLARDVILIALVCYVLYGIGLGDLQLKHEEPRRALVAREMLASHSWLVPQLNGATYLAKPPVFNWQIAFFSAVVGEVNETTARLPSVLGVLGIAFLLYGVGRSCANARTGILAALIVMTTGLVLEKGSLAEIDANFAFWVTAMFFCLFQAYRKPSAQWWVLTYALLAIAFLVKGPPALLFFLAGGASLAWIHRDLTPLRSVAHAVGLLAFVVPVAGWIFSVHVEVGIEALLATAKTEMGDRASGGSILETINIAYYPVVILAAFLPWSPFLVLAGSTLASSDKSTRVLLAKYCLLCPLIAISLFSFSAGKEARYLLPIIPLMALVSADFLDRKLSGDLSERVTRYADRSLVVLTNLLVLGAVALGVIARVDWRFSITMACTIGLVGLAITCVGAFAALKRQTLVACLSIVGILCLYRVAYAEGYVPYSNERKSVAPIVEPINRSIHAGDQIYTVSFAKYLIFFYLDSPVRRLESVEALTAIESSGNSVHCFVTTTEWEEIADLQPGRWKTTAQFTYSNREIYLIMSPLR